MGKSYRRAARRRHVSVRLPRVLGDLVLAYVGFKQDAPVPARRRHQAVSATVPALLACVLRPLIEDAFQDGVQWSEEYTVEYLLRYYSGLPSASVDEVQAFIDKYDR